MRSYLYSLATDRISGPLPALLKAVLWLLSLVYGAGVRVCRYFSLRSTKKLPCATISVGNITVGGTGKTPLVAYISQYLLAKGRHVAILSRGYARKNPRAAEGAGAPDEPQLLQELAQGARVLVDPDRVRSAKRAREEFGADTVVLDDGFQQWKVAKDLEIVAIDATNPFGNRKVLPRGILREPMDALRRADVFVVTKADMGNGAAQLEEYLAKANPAALVVEAAHVPVGFFLAADGSRQPAPAKAVLFSGIGDPASFEALVAGQGVEVAAARRFEDHHAYSEEDILGLFEQARVLGADTVVTTAKDASRLKGVKAGDGNARLLVLRIEISIRTHEQEFHNRLDRIYIR